MRLDGRKIFTCFTRFYFSVHSLRLRFSGFMSVIVRDPSKCDDEPVYSNDKPFSMSIDVSISQLMHINLNTLFEQRRIRA